MIQLILKKVEKNKNILEKNQKNNIFIKIKNIY